MRVTETVVDAELVAFEGFETGHFRNDDAAQSIIEPANVADLVREGLGTIVELKLPIGSQFRAVFMGDGGLTMRKDIATGQPKALPCWHFARPEMPGTVFEHLKYANLDQKLEAVEVGEPVVVIRIQDGVNDKKKSFNQYQVFRDQARIPAMRQLSPKGDAA